MHILVACVDKFQYTALFNTVYHVDLRFGVDQHVYWCELTPQKLPDETKVITFPNNAIDQRNTEMLNTKRNEDNYFSKHQVHRNIKYQRK